MSSVRRVVVVSTFALYTPHFETELELIRNHLESGDEVHVIRCQKSLLSCWANPELNFGECQRCSDRAVSGFSLFRGRIHEHKLSDFWTEKDRQNLASLDWDFENLDELLRYNISNDNLSFDIGEAVLSTLVSKYRDPSQACLSDTSLIKNLLYSAYFQFLTLSRVIRQEKFDLAYAFNGRFAVIRSLLRICQQLEIEVHFHDRGCNEYRYALYKNDMAQSIDIRKRDIDHLWSEASSDQRVQIGREFYHQKVDGESLSWISFTKNQQIGLLPDNFDRAKKIITIFGSSEDEFVAVGEEFRRSIYMDQTSGIKRILGDLAKIERYSEGNHVYIKMHPNLAGCRPQYVRDLENIEFSFVTYLAPESKVSSYELLRNSDRVISFGSTIGIEAAFWQVPSICCGRSYYEDLGSTYHPKSHEEVLLLLSKEIPPLPTVGALKYGYYEKNYGIPFKYFAPDGFFGGKFSGKKINASIATRIYCALSNRLRIIGTFFDFLHIRRVMRRFYTVK